MQKNVGLMTELLVRSPAVQLSRSDPIQYTSWYSGKGRWRSDEKYNDSLLLGPIVYD